MLDQTLHLARIEALTNGLCKTSTHFHLYPLTIAQHSDGVAISPLTMIKSWNKVYVQKLYSVRGSYNMPKPIKMATSTSATPAKTQAKKPSKPAVATSDKAQAKKPTHPAVAARPAKTMAEKKPSKPISPAPARRRPEASPEQRRCYVEVAAYFIAERRGFTPGREHEDWVAAEAEIDRMLNGGLPPP